ncbi:MAG TPA: hypothetical protein VHS99_19040 [Chloroflexota bacterium]|jgi:hypothetical protein|nr:hypothetical protein [Chloroflexota bacterium]
MEVFMAEVVVIRADHLPVGETDRIRIIHTSLEGEKEYDLVVSNGGLWLRFVGKRRLELPRSRQRVQVMNVDL